MDQPDLAEPLATPSAGAIEAPAASSPRLAPSVVASQGCPTCGTAGSGEGEPSAPATPQYIYAVGRIEKPRFPSQSLEKEFAQAVGRSGPKGLTDRQALQSVLSARENRYLVRQMCWVMSIEGLDTYILVPRDPADVDLLVAALRPAPSPMDLDCVIGVRGPMASPRMCNGLMVPIVIFDQIYSFDRDALIKAIPKPDKIPGKGFAAAAEELFDRIMQLADNAGATDEHRALNYCAVRYQAIYAAAAEAFARNASLTGVEVAPSRLSHAHKVLDVIFAFTNRDTDVIEKSFVRVDVTDEFPYLVTKFSPYYDR